MKKCSKCLKHLQDNPKMDVMWKEIDGEMHLVKLCRKNNKYFKIEDFTKDKRNVDGLGSYIRKVAYQKAQDYHKRTKYYNKNNAYYKDYYDKH